MKSSADRGGCYLLRPSASVDKTLQNLGNSLYPTKAKFNKSIVIYSRYVPFLKGVSLFRSLFFCSPKIAQPQPRFSRSTVYPAATSSFDVMGSILQTV